MIIKILTNKDRLILNVVDSIYELALSEFGFDYNKPVKVKENHFIKKDLINEVKLLIKPNRSLKSILFSRDKIFIGVDSKFDSGAIAHHSDFAELIGINNPKIVIKAIPNFEDEDLNMIFSKLNSEKYEILKVEDKLRI